MITWAFNVTWTSWYTVKENPTGSCKTKPRPCWCVSCDEDSNENRKTDILWRRKLSFSATWYCVSEWSGVNVYTRHGILQGIWHWVCACVCVGYHLIDRWAESQCSGLHNQQLYSQHKGLWEERDERSREVQNSKIPGGEEGLPSLLCLFLCFPLNRFSVCVFLGAQVVYLVYFWACALLCVCMCVFFWEECCSHYDW